MNLKLHAEILTDPETLGVGFYACGNSMSPLIKDGDMVHLRPVGVPGRLLLKVDDIVLARVRGRYYLHKVTAVTKNRVQIGNNHGRINGWTLKKKVYGILTQVGT